MIEIKVEDGEVKGLLNRLSGRMRNMGPVMRAISGIMFDAVEENFEQQGRPKWQDLKESTKKQRAKKGKWPGKILQVSQGGLAAANEPGYNNSSAWVSNNKKYAPTHQFGADITHPARERKVFLKKYRSGEKRGRTLFSRESKASLGMKVMGRAYTIHIPARPFMKLTPNDLEKIKRKMGSYLVDGTV
jgi:phage virion morphogenesis protein